MTIEFFLSFTRSGTEGDKEVEITRLLDEAKEEYEQDKRLIMQECDSDLEKKGRHERKEFRRLEKEGGGVDLGARGTYACSECPVVFDKAVDRFNHINTVHIPSRYSCIVCDMKFSYSQDLKSHILKHQDGSGNFACDVCGKGMKRLESLRDASDFHMSSP